MRKIIIFCLVISFFLPSIASAQIDNRCWRKTECEAYRKDILKVDPSQVTDGFDASAEAKAICGATDATGKAELGFCLAAGKSTTKITFGTRNTFEHFGDFIQYIYRYSFIIGSIVAVVMIMLGGVMWIVSGTSPDLKQKAQKRIGGAIMGIILLALSYTILNLVNPYLVNLRMPAVWLINPEGLQPAKCDQLNINVPAGGAKTMVELAYTGQEKYNDKSQTNITSDKLKKQYSMIGSFTQDADKANCGDYYFVPETSAQTCMGTFCKEEKGKENQICVPFKVANNGEKESIGTCETGQLILHFKVSSMWTELLADATWLAQTGVSALANSLEKKWLDNFISFIAVCKSSDGTLYEGSYEWWHNETRDFYPGLRTIKTENVPEYLMTIDKLVGKNSKDWKGNKNAYDKEWCDSKGEVVGFWAYLEGKVMANPFKDARFFIGQHHKSQQAMVGIWDDVGWDNYIPIENIEKGLMLDVTLTQTTINSMTEKKGSWPPPSSKTYAGLSGIKYETKKEEP